MAGINEKLCDLHESDKPTEPLHTYRQQLAKAGIQMTSRGSIHTSPCPFRHLEDASRIPVLYWEDPDADGTVFWVECRGCGARGPLENTPVDAVNAWSGASVPGISSTPTTFERLVLSSLAVLIRLVASRHDGTGDLKSLAVRAVADIERELDGNGA